jgi:hypothetical protein
MKLRRSSSIAEEEKNLTANLTEKKTPDDVRHTGCDPSCDHLVRLKSMENVKDLAAHHECSTVALNGYVSERSHF